jgi:hypothetical protein
MPGEAVMNVMLEREGLMLSAGADAVRIQLRAKAEDMGNLT